MDAKTKRLRQLLETKKWDKENDFIQGAICPICDNLLRTGDELIQKFHDKCITRL